MLNQKVISIFGLMKVWVHNKNYLQTPKTMSTTFSEQGDQTYVVVATSNSTMVSGGFNRQEWMVFFFKAANENIVKMKLAGLERYFECLNEDKPWRKFNLEYSLSQYDIVALDGPAGHNWLKKLYFKEVDAFMTIEDGIRENEASEKIDEVGEMKEEELYNKQDAEIRRDVYALTFHEGECVEVHEVEVRREGEKKIRFMFDEMTVDGEMVGFTADKIVDKINEGIGEWKDKNGYLDEDGYEEEEEEWKDITVEEEEVIVKKKKVTKETAKSKSMQCSHVFTRGGKKDKRCKTKTKKENGLCAKHSRK